MQLENKNHLEFSDNTGLTKQKILFDKSPFIWLSNKRKQGKFDISSEFYDNGYVVLNNISDEKKACSLLEDFIVNIDTGRIPIYKRFLPRIQLAKIDRIPICCNILKKNFQAMHFDMGQPIISESTQTMYLITALYCEPDAVSVNAKTRVANISKLLSQKQWESREIVEKKLIEYVTLHGDGWISPDVVNTFRLACFARVIDAVSGVNELTHLIDEGIGQGFQYGESGDEQVAINNEYKFYEKCGLDLRRVEEQICLSPGQLLIIDNVRTIHGRIGKRKPEELFQFMFGVKSALPEDVDAFRKCLLDQFSV